jgi:predicted small lipoprotein YifL
MGKKLWISLTVYLCLLSLTACGLDGGWPAATEPSGSDAVSGAEQAYPSQDEKEPVVEPAPAAEDGADKVIEPAPATIPDDIETLRLRNRFLIALLSSEYILNARVEMGNPVYAAARLRYEPIVLEPLSFFSNVYKANPGWRLIPEGYSEDYYKAAETEKLYQEMILTLVTEPGGPAYQYHYHDDVWEAVSWPEDRLPFFLDDMTPGWDSAAEKYARIYDDYIIKGEEIFNGDDFYAIYRELGLESDGSLANARGVIERLGMPERFFARCGETLAKGYSYIYLYLIYPFGEVSFQHTTSVKLTDGGVSGPRGTHVGDHYEDVIAKFLREENREDNYFYEIDSPDAPSYYTFVARGEIFYSSDDNEVTLIRYTNGRSILEYEVDNNLVVSISTYMLVDGW